MDVYICMTRIQTYIW